jgi:hypothetical protein
MFTLPYMVLADGPGSSYEFRKSSINWRWLGVIPGLLAPCGHLVLGIKGGTLKQCISDVHIAAVKSLYSICTTKRKLEKPKEPVWHRPTDKKPS